MTEGTLLLTGVVCFGFGVLIGQIIGILTTNYHYKRQ